MKAMTATRIDRALLYLAQRSGAKSIKSSHAPEGNVFLKRYFSREPSKVTKRKRTYLPWTSLSKKNLAVFSFQIIFTSTVELTLIQK